MLLCPSEARGILAGGEGGDVGSGFLILVLWTIGHRPLTELDSLILHSGGLDSAVDLPAAGRLSTVN